MPSGPTNWAVQSEIIRDKEAEQAAADGWRRVKRTGYVWVLLDGRPVTLEQFREALTKQGIDLSLFPYCAEQVLSPDSWVCDARAASWAM